MMLFDLFAPKTENQNAVSEASHIHHSFEHQHKKGDRH
jgi:hypothetical protein